MKPELLTGANLSYIGDAYYELYIRQYLIKKGITNQNKLHNTTVKYVSASAHHLIITKIFDELSAFEQELYKRGRNSKTSSRRNIDEGQHSESSGFEALIGYLYLLNDFQRLNEILEKAIKIIEE